jgi:hypothetical protein
MFSKSVLAALAGGICLTFANPAIAAPEELVIGGTQYNLVDSTLNGCPEIANNTPGVVVIFQHNPTPGVWNRTLWSIFDSWYEVQEINPELAYYPNPSPNAIDQFLGCYRVEEFDVFAATSPLPNYLVDCVADNRFEGFVKYVFRNDPGGIDWIMVRPTTDGSRGIQVEEYVAIPMGDHLGTLFHGAYFVYPDGSTVLDYGATARDQLTYEDAASIADSWDAPYCRKDTT